MANTADVIIIGGGIIGNAIAYYLAKKGTDVIVLEGSDHIGNGGSSRNESHRFRLVWRYNSLGYY